MLQNLLFSLNMNLPLFAMLALGYGLLRRGLFTEEYVARTSSLVYYVLLPAKLFLDISSTDLSAAFDPRYMLVAVAGSLVQFAVAWLCGNLLCPARGKQSAFSHACFRGNFVYLGLALLQNIYGTAVVPSAAVILTLVLPLYNIQGVVLLTAKESQGRVRIRAILIGIFRNPMVLSILAALPFALFHVSMPFVVTKSLGYLQAATSTMALLVVGASVRFDAIRANLKFILRASAVKLVLMPLIWAALALLAGLTVEQTVTLTMVGAMPAAVNVYIITEKMGGDGDLACGVVVVSHLLSLVTLTGIVFLLKTAGLI